MSADRNILRGLAAEVAEVAAQPVQRERIRLWTKLNGLRPERPMLWITEIPWGEFEDKVDALRPICRDPDLRCVEAGLRRTLFTARHLPCDEVVSPVYRVDKVLRDADYGVETREQQIRQGDSYIVSHHYEPVIKEPADIAKVLMPRVVHDEAATRERVAFFDGLFGDILQIETFGVQQHIFNAWDMLVRWTGVTEALVDLVERPEFIHAIMRRMTDSMLARMTQLEALGLLSDTRSVVRVGSGAAGWTDELPRPGADPAHLTTMDQWGMATPQIFSDVSPEMHEEFALAYELEVLSRCGLNYYGCCEPVHNKMDLMAKVPRLRKISISPWCRVAQARDRAARRYVFSHKPSPAILAEDRFNVERAESDLRRRLDESGEMPCEFIMKDISTVRGDVHRLIAWCEMAWHVVNG